MADEGNANTFKYTLAGREITFLRSTPAQMLMMQRIASRIHKQMDALTDDDPGKLGELMFQLNDFVFEAAESRFTDPQDLLFVEQQILRGNISQDEVYGIIHGGRSAAQAPPDDDADPVPAKPPRKAAGRKAPVKKPASPRRATS